MNGSADSAECATGISFDAEGVMPNCLAEACTASATWPTIPWLAVACFSLAFSGFTFTDGIDFLRGRECCSLQDMRHASIASLLIFLR